MITEFVITAGEHRKRLDTFLVHREPEISRSRLQRLIEQGRIRVNEHVVKPSHKVKPGDHITMDTPQPGALQIQGKQIELEVLFEDDVLLIVNKPAGIVVHPTSGNWDGTLVNSLLSHFQNTKQGTLTPGIVHRLDKETSGVMVIAKNREAHQALAVQFEKHSITRHYEAFAWTSPGEDHGVVNLAIGRDSSTPKKHSAQTDSPHIAVTDYRIIERWGTVASRLLLSPQTGRTHQIRVHLATLDVPILGDVFYGGEKVRQIAEITIPRVMLHARILGFQHPISKEYQEYSIDCPPDMHIIQRQLQRMVDPTTSPSLPNS